MDEITKILNTIKSEFKRRHEEYRIVIDEDQIIVHNHIADFTSKYDLDGNLLNFSQKTVACINDYDINTILINISDSINDTYAHYETKVIKPGNILYIKAIS